MEVAEALGVTQAHFSRLVSAGRAPIEPVVSIKGKGGMFLFRREDMERLIMEKKGK